jgi:hypothetical protein
MAGGPAGLTRLLPPLQRCAKPLSRLRRTSLAGAALLALALIPALSPAQENAHDAFGIRAGSFLLYPSLTAKLVFDSNVFAQPSGEIDGWAAVTTPRLEAESNWSRHALMFELQARDVRYFDQTSQNYTDVYGRIIGRLDVRRDLTVQGKLELGREHTPLGSGDAPALAAEPVPDTAFDAELAINKTFNRVKVTLKGGYELNNYDDVPAIGGGTLDQDFRDGDAYEVGGRVAVAISPDTNIFGEVTYTRTEYDTMSATLSDSDTFRALAGFEFAPSALVRGQIGAGYTWRGFDAPSIADEEGFAYLADIIWNPTPLITVTIGGEGRFEDTTVAGASSRLSSAGHVIVDYELLRNLIISPQIRIDHVDYTGIARDDLLVAPGIRVDYMANRYLHFGGEYFFQSRDSSIAAFDYQRHLLGLYAKAQF